MRIEMQRNQYLPEPVARSVYQGEVLEVTTEFGKQLLELGAAKETKAAVGPAPEPYGNQGMSEGRRVPDAREVAPLTLPSGIAGQQSRAITRADVQAIS